MQLGHHRSRNREAQSGRVDLLLGGERLERRCRGLEKLGEMAQRYILRIQPLARNGEGDLRQAWLGLRLRLLGTT